MINSSKPELIVKPEITTSDGIMYYCYNCKKETFHFIGGRCSGCGK